MQQFSMPLVLVALIATLAPAGSSLLRKTDAVPKTDMKIKDPTAGKTLGDVIPEAVTAGPKGQEYDHMYAPVSPRSRGDFSETDPQEYTNGWVGYTADMIDHMSIKTMRRFESSTCDSVCAVCSIFAAQEADGVCECYSTCKFGECGAGSGARPHIGWSNNAVTTPRTLWEAQCNLGEKNCETQCMKDELKKQVKDCKEGSSPAECFKRLKQIYQPLPYDSRKQVHYCTRKGMSTCDTFMNVPTDGGWNCYKYEDKCNSKVAIGFKTYKAGWAPPSVWKSVR